MSLKRRSLAALLGGVVAACVAAAPAAAVVNGDAVEPASVPWFASVGSCGGTLVAPDRVLTAAHCVGGMSVSENLNHIEVGGVVRQAIRVAMHPGWRNRNGSSNFLDDVAVIELDQPVTGVALVTLGGIGAGAGAGEARILGRGRRFAPGTGHSEAEMLDSTLRTAVLRTISDRACARAFKGYKGSSGERFDRRMRCSIDADGRKPLFSGCNGDSGGPLWVGTPDAPVQLGVVSWGGDRCGADHLPSVFADVALYRDFITDPSPTWAPTKTGRASISGTARAGRKLSCSAPGYTLEAGARLGYTWLVVGAGRGFGRPKTVGRRKVYKVAQRDRGRLMACRVDASNDGGYVTVGLANRRIGR
jgi:Trypsin